MRYMISYDGQLLLQVQFLPRDATTKRGMWCRNFVRLPSVTLVGLSKRLNISTHFSPSSIVPLLYCKRLQVNEITRSISHGYFDAGKTESVCKL